MLREGVIVPSDFAAGRPIPKYSRLQRRRQIIIILKFLLLHPVLFHNIFLEFDTGKNLFMARPIVKWISLHFIQVLLRALFCFVFFPFSPTNTEHSLPAHGFRPIWEWNSHLARECRFWQKGLTSAFLSCTHFHHKPQLPLPPFHCGTPKPQPSSGVQSSQANVENLHTGFTKATRGPS